MKIILGCWLFCALCASPAMAYERIFYENCEDTAFSEWFLERSMGTSSYWDELTSEITRSTENPYSGNFSMTYDPFTTGNPHGNIGVGVTHGNTDGFIMNDVDTSTYYFRWQQRWQEDIDYSGSVENKILYLGYGEWGGDFTFTLKKDDAADFHITIRSNPGYTIRHNLWSNEVAYSLDDMEWHKFEVYIDLGTTGTTGYFFLKIDDVLITELENVHFRDQVQINNGAALGIIQWPSNVSGTQSGTSVTWLDDLEIYLLDEPTDIPPEIGTDPSTPQPPRNFRNEE